MKTVENERIATEVPCNYSDCCKTEECKNPEKSIVLTGEDVDEWNKYNQLKSQGLLKLKVWKIEYTCLKPVVCILNCDSCLFCELTTKEDFINPSDFDKEKHFETEEEAKQALELKELKRKCK